MPEKTEIIIVENEDRQSRLASLEQLLLYRYTIPFFQREYAWNEKNFEDLLNTIKENHEAKRETFLGSIIVSDEHGVSNNPKKTCSLIDGQQRITSFLMLLKFIRIKMDEIIKETNNSIKQIEKDLLKAKKEVNVDKIEECAEKKIQENSNKSALGVNIAKIDHILKNRIQREGSHRDFTSETAVLKYISEKNSSPGSTRVKKCQKCLNDFITDDVIGINNYLDYLLEKCTFCFLIIQGDGAEDHAIEIFNSLNSTGEPLTAFEILKSSIYGKFQEKAEPLKEVEENLQEKKFPRLKQSKYTDRLILFLSFLTKKLHNSKPVNFREKKKIIDDILRFNENEIDNFVKTTSNLHQFIISHWEFPEKKITKSEDVAVCFSFLKALGHDRIIPVLYHFHENKANLNDAIKACTAFTCLWRGMVAEGRTGGIDSQYEHIIKGLSDIKNIDKLKEEMQSRLKKKLSPNHHMQKSWVSYFKDNSIYKSKKIARFFLFIAFHNKVFHKNELKRSKHKFLREHEWESDDYKTIEHILPQSYKVVDKIGNLILLPQVINSKVGKKEFEKKVKAFKECLDHEHSKEIPYIRILDEIVSYNPKISCDEYGYMNMETIEERGTRLGNAIWETLAIDWLEWKEGK